MKPNDVRSVTGTVVNVVDVVEMANAYHIQAGNHA